MGPRVDIRHILDGPQPRVGLFIEGVLATWWRSDDDGFKKATALARFWCGPHHGMDLEEQITMTTWTEAAATRGPRCSVCSGPIPAIRLQLQPRAVTCSPEHSATHTKRLRAAARDAHRKRQREGRP